MRRLSVLAMAWLALVVGATFATAQREDVLILDGKEHWIQTNPLEAFLDTQPNKRPGPNITSTDLWRKYVATWEMVGDRLFLIDIAAQRQKPNVEGLETELYSVMSNVFPGQQQVLATWFTGHIIVPRGDLLEYVHLDYASTFENYIVLTIRNGHLTNQVSMNSTEFLAFRESQFRAYQKTEEYKTSFEELKDPGDTDEDVESFLFKASAGHYMSLINDPER